MIYILLSICCSIIVSVMLKLAKRYHIDVYQASSLELFHSDCAQPSYY